MQKLRIECYPLNEKYRSRWPSKYGKKPWYTCVYEQTIHELNWSEQATRQLRAVFHQQYHPCSQRAWGWSSQKVKCFTSSSSKTITVLQAFPVSANVNHQSLINWRTNLHPPKPWNISFAWQWSNHHERKPSNWRKIQYSDIVTTRLEIESL